jgi:hypothetical protein
MKSSTYSKIKSILSESRPSKEHPIEGHPYHYKSDESLRYIMKDAGEAAKAMRTHGTISGDKAEAKYLDQVNDAATVLGWRKRNGTPDWYAKKYLSKDSYHESVEQLDEVNIKQIKKDLDSGMSYDRVIGKHANKRTSNTDEIRKVIQQHAWDKRMKKEAVEEIEEVSKETLQSYMDKALKQSMEAGAEKIAGKVSKKKPRWKGIEKANVKFWKKV